MGVVCGDFQPWEEPKKTCRSINCGQCRSWEMERMGCKRILLSEAEQNALDEFQGFHRDLNCEA